MLTLYYIRYSRKMSWVQVNSSELGLTSFFGIPLLIRVGHFGWQNIIIITSPFHAQCNIGCSWQNILVLKWIMYVTAIKVYYISPLV